MTIISPREADNGSLVPETRVNGFTRKLGEIDKPDWISIDVNPLGDDRIECLMLISKPMVTERDIRDVQQAQSDVWTAANSSGGNEEKSWAKQDEQSWNCIWNFSK